MGGVELLVADYRMHAFPAHAHETAVVGLVERGSFEFSGGGRTFHVAEGDLLVITPGVVHQAESACRERWTYRALYLSPGSWDRLGPSGSDVPVGAHRLRSRRLYQLWRELFTRLVGRHADECELMSAVHEVQRAVRQQDFDAEGSQAPARLIQREEVSIAANSREQMAGGAASGGARTMSQHAVVTSLEQVRRLLERDVHQRRSLDELARLAGMSRFHFLRTFAREYGMPPCAYARLRRIREVQRRLAMGAPISMTAMEYGFADQAHLTRHFLRTVGVTPGEYQRAFVEARRG